MNRIKQIHACALRNDVPNIEHLLFDLLRLPSLPYAHAVLVSYPHPPSTYLHNKLLQVYAAHHSHFLPYLVSLYAHMHRHRGRGHAAPNRFTYVFLFSAASASAAAFGSSLHGRFILSGIPLDPFLATSLLDLYAKTGLLPSARRLFDETPVPDAPLWNSLIGGYARHGLLDAAKELFETMPAKNVISWTSMVSGYAQNGMYSEAVDIFIRMWEDGSVQPNEVTLASVLPACANLGAMGMGEKIEAYAMEHGLKGNAFVSNALVEMYAKCGNIEHAWRVFEEMGNRRNLCSWNSMIVGLAVHGRWREALKLFHEMQVRGIVPDDITFVGVLLACIHGGMVDEGHHFFNYMEKDFALTPKLQHYGCMVDLLGRAGLLKEAYSLITSMPMEPDSVVWGALLGACSFHGEVPLAEIAAGFLFKLEPWNSGNYVILANIYASSGKWDCVSKVWKLMKGKQHKKSAGYSLIELDGRIHKFIIEDKSHARFEEIYTLLDEITARMKLLGYRPKLSFEVES